MSVEVLIRFMQNVNRSDLATREGPKATFFSKSSRIRRGVGERIITNAVIESGMVTASRQGFTNVCVDLFGGLVLVERKAQESAPGLFSGALF